MGFSPPYSNNMRERLTVLPGASWESGSQGLAYWWSTSGEASMPGSGGWLMSMTQGRMGWNAGLPMRRAARWFSCIR